MADSKRRSGLIGLKTRSTVVAVLAIVATALFAQGAQASTTPTLTLDQSGGTQAGATQNLGMDLKFTDSLSDSPDAMTINLPPGLLANAAIDGGACLKTADLSDTNCQVGTGTVTADAIVDLVNLDALTVPVTFDLVPPPAAGDLAGLAVNLYGQQIGQTADIKVRPSGDPAGVGVSIDFVLPDTLAGAPIEVTEINSTFDGLRYPTTCPSTPAKVSVSVDSYQDATVHTVTSPLSVTGCSSLPYAPKLALSAVKDKADRSVALTTTATQAADESPSRSLTLAFPGQTIGVNLAAIRLLCGNVTTDHCTPVGTATADSPLYPNPLTANAYLTGTALGPTLTLAFPPPFPLTLVGAVTLTTKTATFTGLPDIPLTSLKLVLNGGAAGMFLTNCNPGAGVADGSSTDQNGDKTVSAKVNYSIVGCAASSSSSTGKANSNSGPTVSGAVLTDSKSGQPSLSFRVTVRKHAPKLTQLTVKLSHGISLVRHRVGKHLRVTGVSLTGAHAKSLSISGGRLVIRLRRPASSFRVKLTKVLHENNAVIAAAAKGKTVRLRMTLTSLNTRHRRHTVSKLIKLHSV